MKNWFRPLDFAICFLSFVVPLYWFPEKSRLITQCIIGLICAFTVLFFSNYNRMISFRRTLPLISELYGPFLGLLAAFGNISFLAFIYQEYLFSRYINIIGLILAGLYFLMSRLLTFKQLSISNIDLKESSEKKTLPGEVLELTDKNGKNVKLVSLPVEFNQNLDSILLGLGDDPWSVFDSKVVFYDNGPYLQLVKGGRSWEGQETNSFLKRPFDLFLASLLLFVLIPISFLIYVLSLIFHRENPIFAQKRVGLRGKVFSIYKFKSFFGGQDKPSAWGSFLRKSNLDEIPQLVNIIRGDMAFVGPRAEMVEKTDAEFLASRRNSVRPGLTGFWQLGPFRSESIKSHVEYDIYYLLVRSFLIDLIVILLTPFIAFTNNRNKV